MKSEAIYEIAGRSPWWALGNQVLKTFSAPSEIMR
jgi:hypothetical protein